MWFWQILHPKKIAYFVISATSSLSWKAFSAEAGGDIIFYHDKLCKAFNVNRRIQFWGPEFCENSARGLTITQIINFYTFSVAIRFRFYLITKSPPIKILVNIRRFSAKSLYCKKITTKKIANRLIYKCLYEMIL